MSKTVFDDKSFSPLVLDEGDVRPLTKKEQKQKKRELKREYKQALATARDSDKKYKSVRRENKARSRSLKSQLRAKDKDKNKKRDRMIAKRAGATNVSDFIGYEQMYKDGLCEVDAGLFSETIRFTDVSYQSARTEIQENIFSCLCQLYDYFGNGVYAQFNVFNTPIPKEEVGKRKFFDEEKVGDNARFAHEYNEILNTKMREGVSNIKREILVTYAVNAENADRATQKLARIRSQVTQQLNSIRSDAELLDGTARLRVLASQLRPAKVFDFDYERDLSGYSGLTTKDYIAPLALNFRVGDTDDQTYFKTDDMYGQVLVMRTFGSELTDHCVSEIADLQIPLNISWHVTAWDKSEALAYVSRQGAWIDKEIVEEQQRAVKKGYDFTILPSNLTHSKDQTQAVLTNLSDYNQHLYDFTGLVYTYAPTKEELTDQVIEIINTARSNSIEIEPLDYLQREALNSVLPLGLNHMNIGRKFTTNQVGMFIPFATQELDQEGGGYYGQNKLSNNLVICNRRKLASPMGFICGKPGSGKSFSVKREIENTILAYPEDEIIVFDPAGEYTNITKDNGGVEINLSPDTDTFLNPFDMQDVSHMAHTSQMAFKIEAMLALSNATMSESNERLSQADKSIISRCVETLYKAGSSDTPILGDFYELLLEQPEPEARDIALRYERLVNGSMSFFNKPSNVGFEKRLTNIRFKDLSQDMRVFGMLTALEATRNKMYYNYERGITTWLYIDEVQSLFAHEAVIEYISRFYAERRKFNLICTGMTQNSAYMLQNEVAQNIILNSDFIMLHKQSPVDRELWAGMLNLSDAECGYIDESIRAGEGLLIAGNARIPIKDDFPKGELYDLFNTKADEVAEIKRRQWKEEN